MPVFAVEYHYDPDLAGVRDEHRPAHRAWLADLVAAGTVLESGPYPDGSGALLLFTGTDIDDVTTVLANDPFAAAGAIADTRVTEWRPIMGPFTGRG
ncbi:YciI family protein [Williamsia sp. CHRR-6]|uniref:YciI family protein n=1 Tax=Williamsia sp. CHRR-6 TaxID=2835871 RepID=UPI001BD98AA4|nr:YciI family protein [Williamsia sp. CHRR-6]MBT0567887.1 hypothetical protein [Williamsia sp. CHRR-6]